MMLQVKRHFHRKIDENGSDVGSSVSYLRRDLLDRYLMQSGKVLAWLIDGESVVFITGPTRHAGNLHRYYVNHQHIHKRIPYPSDQLRSTSNRKHCEDESLYELRLQKSFILQTLEDLSAGDLTSKKKKGFSPKHSLWGLIMILMADTHMLEGMCSL
ncbi:hypothetical protein OH690_05285 [Escherichia coli]|nr:hypothetical protein [Escherichia coli]